MSSDICRLDEGVAFVWTIDPDAEWAYSKFPYPLITVDYDANDSVIKMVAVGPEAERLEKAVADNATSRLRDLMQAEVADEVEQALRVRSC